MNYLVTGAAGFIGSAIAQYLIDNGNTCTTIDNLFTGKEQKFLINVDLLRGMFRIRK